jgi:hypothetical protein
MREVQAPQCPIDQCHRHARSKDSVRRLEFVVADRLNRLPCLKTPLAARPRHRRRGIVIPADEDSQVHERVVAPDKRGETVVEAAPLVRNEPIALPGLSLDVGQNLPALVVKSERMRRSVESLLGKVPQQVVDR